MLKLNLDSIEWAFNHLRKYYDSDFYPRLFEFSAIGHNWNSIKAHLASLDLNNYTPKSPISLPAPKPNWNFRIVHQLHPLDSIIYTSLIYEIARDVEDFRNRISEGQSLSYKVNISDQGDLFNGSSSYSDFLDSESTLLKKFETGYIIYADIADFYNQIYIHRIQNLISEASEGRLDNHSVCIENFLMALNRGSSKGIPVGPSASIILAEIIMADIDRKISSHTKNYIRYVDDIRIFFTDEKSAINAFEDLNRYLYSYHRLIFSSSKTGIVKTSAYESKVFSHEQRNEEIATEIALSSIVNSKMEEILSEYDFEYNDYYLSQDLHQDLTEKLQHESEFQAQSQAYKELFLIHLKAEPINYSMLRHILKKATRYRIRSLISDLLFNMELMFPVYRESIIYLKAVIVKDNISKYSKSLQHLWELSFSNLPFIEKWNIYLFSDANYATILENKIYDSLKDIRNKSILAKARKDLLWIRNHRDKIHSLGEWDRWAVLYSSISLPSAERKHWLGTLNKSLDMIDESIINKIKSE